MTVSVCLCLSAREHIPGITHSIFTNFLHVSYGRDLVGKSYMYVQDAAKKYSPKVFWRNFSD